MRFKTYEYVDESLEWHLTLPPPIPYCTVGARLVHCMYGRHHPDVDTVISTRQGVTDTLTGQGTSQKSKVGKSAYNYDNSATAKGTTHRDAATTRLCRSYLLAFFNAYTLLVPTL